MKDKDRMHGEYKVPNGKLVVVDFEIDYKNNHIHNMSISGDFFLEPPEVLNIINETLSGIDYNLSNLSMKKIIDRNIPKETELFGFSSEDIVTAIKKASLCL